MLERVHRREQDVDNEMDDIRRVRAACPASQFFFVGVPRTLDRMVELMRAGIDITIQRDEQMAALLSSVLNLVQTHEPERYRILVVEDSRVAIAQIQRALKQHGIDSFTIPDPSRLFEAIEDYVPDLVLMDMYMPGCNGVEATRAANCGKGDKAKTSACRIETRDQLLAFARATAASRKNLGGLVLRLPDAPERPARHKPQR